MYRVLFGVYRKPGLSYEDFLAHYEDVHVPIARRFAGLRAYDIHPVVPGDDDDGPDAFAIMTFDSEEDFQAVLASPEFAAAVADNEQFVDRFDTYVVGHIPVVDGAAA
jgi:uncharacterized protein (TIGR02118 family)